ncbi:hypothetical protein PoB_004189300 [Plakobranchus ocellatus]|uniref:Uncharacterized protein n=1 Tax=Plakobranchus ocellatus TaxID=259542 RepID=A0AAV4B991_9GAST|nr:hypothetical protein PoB_004189300 [Plakobranchus ocellatus]
MVDLFESVNKDHHDRYSEATVNVPVPLASLEVEVRPFAPTIIEKGGIHQQMDLPPKLGTCLKDSRLRFP